jgi:succinate dehydrogenase/fumarate reductase flavoprotein subunit
MKMIEMDRRHALQLGAAGAALALCPPMIANARPLPRSALRLEQRQCQVLVMGGGVAGVMAALAARRAGASVVLADKAAVGTGGMSPWAQFWLDPRGREAVLADRLLAQGDGLVNRAWLEATLSHGAEAASLMAQWRWPDCPPLQRRAMWLKQLQAAGVTVVERAMIAGLLMDRDGSFAGAVALLQGTQASEPTALLIRAGRGVLAVGSGALRAPGSMLWGQTHDATALAWQAGATIRGKDFTDLGSPYPGYDLGGGTFPQAMQEAGGSALIRTDPVAELRVMQGLADPPERAPARLPGAGVLTGDGVVAAPQDASVAGVPGLHAAGAALASNLAGAVYREAGLGWTASAAQGLLAGAAAGGGAAAAPPGVPDADRLEQTLAAIWAPRARKEGYSPAWLRQNLQQTVTPYFVSYLKRANRLEGALTLVDHLAGSLYPMVIAASGHEWRAALELGALLRDQQLRLRASLARTETRGSHRREDHPQSAAKPYWLDLSRAADGGIAIRQTAATG